jgi:hypothetical protein
MDFVANMNSIFTSQMIEANAAELKYSMEFAPAKEDGNGRIIKDKSSERKKGIPAEEATHLSDAANTIIFGEFRFSLDDFNAYYFDVQVR